MVNNPALVEVMEGFFGSGTGKFIILLTPEQVRELPDGSKVTSYFGGEILTKGQDYIDLDTRCGFTAFGLPVEEFE